MMSEPTTVDGITQDELTGKIVLLIEEDRPWHETDLMHQQLSAKVRNYVRYIRSADFAAGYGERPEDTIVRLVSAVAPGEVSLEFFGRVSWELAKHRIVFEHQVGEDGIPDEIAPIAQRPDVATEATPSETPAPKPTAAAPPPVETPVEEAAPAEPDLTELEVSAGDIGVPEVDEFEPPAFEPRPPIEAEAPPEPVHPTAELEPTHEAEAPQLEPPDLEAAAGPLEELPDEVMPPTGFEPGFPLLDEETPLEAAAPPEEPAAKEALDWEPARIEEASELERLLEADDELEQLLEQVHEAGPDQAAPEQAKAEAAGRPRKPSFFPEEEFGRALPDMDEVEAILSAKPVTTDGEEPVIETSSGKRISLGAPSAAAPIARPFQAPAKLVRAALAAGSAALAGAIIWALLSLGAGHGASPLAAAIGLMVGISVRLKGEGHTLPFRLIGITGTLIGSAIGAVMASAALTAVQDDLGFGGVFSVLGSPGAILTALDRFYGPIDLISLVLAGYIAFRLSASKAPG